MLKIKFWRIENVLLMQVLEQGNEIKRENFKFCASNGIEVKRLCRPELIPDIIYVRGSEEEYDDNIVPCEYSNAEEAKAMLARYIEAVKEYNTSLLRKSNDKDDIEIETVIAE